MSDKEWWRGKALSQDTHERINARHYPGTRQLCVLCDEPTGHCEEDSLSDGDIGPLCEACYEMSKSYQELTNAARED